MTKILAIGGQKGGTGKSTVAVNLAAYWHASGRKVLLVDADPQGTTTTWSDVALEINRPCPVTIAATDTLRRDLPDLAQSYDVAVVDLPGRGGKRQAAALMVCDLAVLVYGPGTPDVWSLEATAETIAEAREVRPEIDARVLLNKVAQTVESREARALMATTGLTLLTSELGQRVAFSQSLAAGQGVGAYAAGSHADGEIEALCQELEALLWRRRKRRP